MSFLFAVLGLLGLVYYFKTLFDTIEELKMDETVEVEIAEGLENLKQAVINGVDKIIFMGYTGGIGRAVAGCPTEHMKWYAKRAEGIRRYTMGKLLLVGKEYSRGLPDTSLRFGH